MCRSGAIGQTTTERTDLAALDDLAVTLQSSVLPADIPVEGLLCAIEEIDFDRIMEII